MFAGETRTCPSCGEEFFAQNPRRMYCDKQCADKARNLPAIPVGKDGLVDLKHFGKFPREIKQAVLRGETGHSIVLYDIECTHLSANVGRILCASFKPLEGDVYTFSALAPQYKQLDVYDDSKLAVAIRNELEKYDIIVGHNSKMFDTKFINARCLRVGERTKQAQYQVDTMWSWQSKARAWKGLKSVQKFLGTQTEKTEIAWEQWMRALGWDKRLRELAMNEIVEHCELDVIALEEVYKVLADTDVIRSLRRDGGIL